MSHSLYKNFLLRRFLSHSERFRMPSNAYRCVCVSSKQNTAPTVCIAYSSIKKRNSPRVRCKKFEYSDDERNYHLHVYSALLEHTKIV